MNQCEGGGAIRVTADWTTQRAMEGKPEEEEEEQQETDGADTGFSSCYTQMMMCSTQPAGGTLQAEAHNGVQVASDLYTTSDLQVASDLQVEPQRPQSRDDSQLLSDNQLLPLSSQSPRVPLLSPADESQSRETSSEFDGAFITFPHEEQRAGEDGFVEESDVKASVCRPETEGESFSLKEESLTPEETSSGKLGDGRMEDPEQSGGEISGLKEKRLSHSEAERTGGVWTDDRCEELRDDVETREEICGRTTGEDPAGSGFLEDGENTRKSVDESEEKLTSCVSLQMEDETRSPAETSSSSSSSSSFTLSEAPRRPSFYFSWLNPLHKRK